MLIKKICKENKFRKKIFNINLLKTDSDHIYLNITMIYVANFLKLLVLQPTCITGKSKSQIDNIFFNSLVFKTLSRYISR